ncbi:hypothetical protein FKW77_003374 [Venturia effusa]|uniref:Rhodopsin domain-containing protein n=1 Tax=Venturia effusa TaxID=50376 RepID=A0A517LQY8_9PEZI|nr:hypothetical protein FKW77_003374 [Venturia effusa]
MSTPASAVNLPPESESTLPRVVATTATLWSIALITYVLRIYSRFRPYPNLGRDDLAISLAMLTTTANWACNLGVQITTGGRHVQYITKAQLERAGQLGFISMVLWIWALTALKISVCLMLLRIKQTTRWKAVQCIPVEANWTMSLRMSGHNCWSEQKQEIVTYAVSGKQRVRLVSKKFVPVNGYAGLFAITDIACALLPLLFILKIDRPLRERLTLSLLMAMGLFACACGIVKTCLVRGSLITRDPIWGGSSTALWTYAEEYIGIIAANIPCLKSLLEAFFHRRGRHDTTTLTTISDGKDGHHDLDSLPLTRDDVSPVPPDKTYKTYPTRMEADPIGYHASLRETSRLKRLERVNESQEDILLQMKGMRRTEDGFEFEFVGGDEKGRVVTRQVCIHAGRGKSLRQDSTDTIRENGGC